MNHLQLLVKLLIVSSLLPISCREYKIKDESSIEKRESDTNSRSVKMRNQLFGDLAIIICEYKTGLNSRK